MRKKEKKTQLLEGQINAKENLNERIIELMKDEVFDNLLYRTTLKTRF